ncbi:MAG: site-specific integrase [Pseudomonadota bacterium]|nr:site-specific integrase [Pseudomonadota bacterium]
MATIRRLKSKKYLAEVRKAKQYKSKTFSSKVQAMAWAAQVEQALDANNSIAGKTVGDAFTRYRDEVSPSRKGQRSEINRLNKFLRHPISNLLLSDINQIHIYDWIEESLTSIKSSSVNRYLNLMSGVFEQAKRWNWTNNNPIRGIKRPKNPQPRDRRISDKEIEKILDALGFDGETVTTHKQIIAVAFLLAIETALRQSELWKLTWEDVYLNKRFIRLHETKNGTKRDVPLSTEAVRLLTLLSPKEEGKVFASNQASSGTIFRRCLKQTGIQNLTFHDTRHEALTRLARKLEVLDLARMVGHKDPRSLMIYYNATAEEIAARLG